MCCRKPNKVNPLSEILSLVSSFSMKAKDWKTEQEFLNVNICRKWAIENWIVSLVISFISNKVLVSSVKLMFYAFDEWHIQRKSFEFPFDFILFSRLHWNWFLRNYPTHSSIQYNQSSSTASKWRK